MLILTPPLFPGLSSQPTPPPTPPPSSKHPTFSLGGSTQSTPAPATHPRRGPLPAAPVGVAFPPSQLEHGQKQVPPLIDTRTSTQTTPSPQKSLLGHPVGRRAPGRLGFPRVVEQLIIGEHVTWLRLAKVQRTATV